MWAHNIHANAPNHTAATREKKISMRFCFEQDIWNVANEVINLKCWENICFHSLSDSPPKHLVPDVNVNATHYPNGKYLPPKNRLSVGPYL